MTIHYIMDPLCGWCYAAIPHIAQLQQAFKGTARFNVVPAGQWAGSKARRLTPEETDQLRENNLWMSSVSGAEFGPAYESNLASGISLDSEMPSRAIVTFQTLLPDRAAECASAIQIAHFRDGKDLNAISTYQEICRSLRVDPSVFLQTFHLPYLFQVTRDAFRMAEIYARTFPSVWFESKKSFYLVKQGYATFAELADGMEAILSAQPQGFNSRMEWLFSNASYLTFRQRCA